MSIKRRQNRILALAGTIVIASVIAGFSDRAAASFFFAGTDHFESQGVWDFFANPIPADFFGPGSLPFDGFVLLEGVPLNPALPDTTDTIVRRLTDADFQGGTAPATVPIEMVALQLRSTQPITVEFGDGSTKQCWMDVMIDTSQSQTGQYHLEETSLRGGNILNNSQTRFDAAFNLEFMDVGHTNGDANGNGMMMMRRQAMGLDGNVPWSFDAHPIHDFGDNGGFYPGWPPGNGLQAVVNDPRVPLLFFGDEFGLRLLLAQVPEPTSMALLAAGGMFMLRRRTKAQHLA